MLIYLYIRSKTAETLRLWRRYDRAYEGLTDVII